MPKYKVTNEGDGFYTIQDVPVFEMHTDRGFPCDATWMKAAIANHESFKLQGYRPTIIIGHNVKGQEKEAVGFLDKLALRGKRLYANLVRVPKEIKEKIVRNSYPSRSVEVLPQSKRILALALLGGTTPHFALPQMAYEETNETCLWFRSPEMALDDETKKEIYDLVGESIATHFGTAVGELTDNNNGDEATEIFADTDTGEQYAVPAALAGILKGAKGLAHVGKATAAGGKIAAKAGLPAGAGRAVGRQVGKAGRFVKRHPVGAAGAAAAGVAAGRVSKHSIQGYSVDEETGEVYYDGQPLGLITTYEEMEQVGMDVPTAVKKPDALPSVTAADPQLKIAAADVGVGSGINASPQTAPPAITGTEVQPLAREDSDQFASAINEQQEEIYDLHQRLERAETANALVVEGRKAEEYTKWLEGQKASGIPVGDIEKTVEFMMTLTQEQVDQHKLLLLSQPKVAFGKVEETVNFANEIGEAEIKADYQANKKTYKAMGVSDNDLKWAGFVRHNSAINEAHPQA